MYQYNATLIRVIDGDTVVMDIDLGFNIWLRDIHLRLVGINTPERGQSGFDAATEFVEKFFEGQATRMISVYKQGKYGRWLVEVWDEHAQSTLNNQLLEKNLAVPYII